jgi:hypothetical protein
MALGEESNPWEPALWLGGILFALFALWWVGGGPERDGGIRGLFVAPPPPIGSGEVYGPEIAPASTTNQE